MIVARHSSFPESGDDDVWLSRAPPSNRARPAAASQWSTRLHQPSKYHDGTVRPMKLAATTIIAQRPRVLQDSFPS